MPSAGGNPERIEVALVIDANTLAFGASIEPPHYGLSGLVETLPAEAQAFLAWVPDISIDAFGVMFDPSTSAFGVYATAGDAASAHPSAELFVADVPVGEATQYVVGVSLSSTIDLSGTPLFGNVLAGISISNLTFTYASGDIPENAVVLPPPAPAHQPAYKQGAMLSFTISDGVSSQDFRLTPSMVSGVTSARSPDGADPPPSPDGDDPPPSPPTQWFSIQKTFGPLTLGRIGIVAAEDEFGLALDASLKTAALGIDLVGFTLAFKPKSDISLHGLKVWLDGLDVSFEAGAVALAGSLVRRKIEVQGKEVTEYDGSVLIQAGPYGIQGAGAYADLDGAPSLFVFGIAEGPFGGPPAFFVEGIAAGFGYNRGLKLPTADQVQDFPMVLAATEGSSYLPDPGVGSALSKLSEGGWVPPETGSYWIAAGIKFTSFETVDAFALLTVQFGHDLVIALLGEASVQLPQEGEAYAFAQMVLVAVLDPSQGTFQVTALLTPASFVLYRDCRLTGGFAFYLWFGSNEHAGDFVVTLGGYNAGFQPPDWYPDVPRLGFDWNVSDDVRLRGGAYFALTPSCVMAGGGLSLTYDSGDLHAWFTAQADFIMYWKPFFFDVYIGVSIGASYTLNLLFTRKTLTVELSADVELWGPPLAGVAHVSWWVISFSIPINGGGSPNGPGKVIDWTTFRSSFLPADATAGALEDGGTPESNVCHAQAAAGLLGTFEEDGAAVWLVSADSFVLMAQTVTPATSVEVCGPSAETTLTFTGPQLGVYPMGSVELTSPLAISICPWSDGSPGTTPEDLSRWTWTPATGNFPQSLWGTQNSGSPAPSAAVVPGLSGATGVPPEPVLTGPPEMPLAVLKWVDLTPRRPLPLPYTPAIDGSTTPPSVDPRTTVAQTIATTAVAERASVVEVLNAAAIGTGLEAGTMETLARDIFVTFQSAPMAGPLGTTGPKSPASTPTVTTHAPRRRVVSERGARRELAAVYRTGRSSPRSPLTAVPADAFTPRTERLAAAALLEGDGSATTVKLRPGTGTSWDLPPGGATLGFDGILPVRVVSFDRRYRPVEDQSLDAGRPSSLSLHPHAEQVVLLCPGGSDGEAAGWDHWSDLVQVNPQALLGRGVVVRPQSPLLFRRGRGTRPTGVSLGRTFDANNRVAVGAEPRPGWIDTWLPHGTSDVDVAIERVDPGAPGPAETAASVHLDVGGGWIELPWEREYAEGEDTHFVYEVGVPDAAGPVRVRVQPTASWRVAGVRAPGAGRVAAKPAPPEADAVTRVTLR